MLATCRTAFDLLSHYSRVLGEEQGRSPAEARIVGVQEAKARLTELEERVRTKEKSLQETRYDELPCERLLIIIGGGGGYCIQTR